MAAMEHALYSIILRFQSVLHPPRGNRRQACRLLVLATGNRRPAPLLAGGGMFEGEDKAAGSIPGEGDMFPCAPPPPPRARSPRYL